MKRTHVRPLARGPHILTRDYQEASVPILGEVLCAVELALLHASPVYYGLGTAHGDGSGVVLVPGFLFPDHQLFFLHRWLRRIGYQPFFSGIRLNAECPNLLIQRRLNQTIERALTKTRRRIHLIGHSLGGIIARSIAAQRPRDIASVITLGAPFRGTVAHSAILLAAEAVRLRILKKHGPAVLPDCYTGHCTCDFVDSLQCSMPPSVVETAVYTPDDGVVDWRYCRTGNSGTDFRVSGTHMGLAFNPSVYTIVADRLAQTHCAQSKLRPRRARVASRVKCATT
ncbi:MAG TPA: alpha/beta fold hydrolase [Candidatus Sulfotelmatobacter sp.]|nr:alpha/beta fold hydrolase [Candidatus Sulfotelmatobacter sp.]